MERTHLIDGRDSFVRKGGTKTLTAADASPQVIRQFKTSLTAVAASCNRNLPDADVAARAELPARPLPFPLLETHVKRSKERRTPGGTRRDHPLAPRAWREAKTRPCGGSLQPMQPLPAKHAITREGDISAGPSSPEMDREEFLNRKELDESKSRALALPTSASQARP